MRRERESRLWAACGAARAFTLIEVLVVVAISALLISILLPALSSAKEAANVTKCLANLREIAATANMYMDDEGYPAQPWHMGGDPALGPSDQLTEYVYGGFMVPEAHPVFGSKIDVRKILTHVRPFNKYIAPGFCQGPIATYICPSDRFVDTPSPNDPCELPIRAEGRSSWSSNGNSYAINWNWLEAEPWSSKRSFSQDVAIISAAGSEMLNLKIGGPASEFILFMENPMNAYIQEARPRGGELGDSCQTELTTGWHKKMSKHSAAYLDGHAEHRYYDTRFTSGPGYDVWPEPNTRRGF